MTDYLLRLAEGALGRGGGIAPRIPSRFARAPEPLLVEAPPQEMPTAPEPSVPSPAPPPPQLVPSRPPGDAEVATPRPAPVEDAAPTRAAAGPSAPSESAPFLRPRPAALERPSPPWSPAPARGESLVALEPVAPQPVLIPWPRTPLLPTAGTTGGAEVPAQRSAAPTRPSPQRQLVPVPGKPAPADGVEHTMARAPEPSPSESGKTHLAALPALPASPAPPAAGAPVAVEVHIGRIEVHAAPAATSAPVRRVVKARPALSLDDYLRRRAGEKS